MRTEDEMVRAAQANALVGGVVDALALGRKEPLPSIEKVVVIWVEERAEGEQAASMMALDSGGEAIPPGQLFHILGACIAATAQHVTLPHADEETWDE